MYLVFIKEEKRLIKGWLEIINVEGLKEYVQHENIILSEFHFQQMMSEKKAADAAQRRSLLLLEETLEDSERVSQLVEEVKNLTKTLEEERLNHKKEVKWMLETCDMKKMENLIPSYSRSSTSSSKWDDEMTTDL